MARNELRLIAKLRSTAATGYTNTTRKNRLARPCSDCERPMTPAFTQKASAVGVPPPTNGATGQNRLRVAGRVIAEAFTSALLNSAISTTSLARSAVSDWTALGVAPAPHAVSVDTRPTSARQPATAGGTTPEAAARQTEGVGRR
jgi:hypothetical protein